MHSLFEEQIEREELSFHHHTVGIANSNPEATSYFPTAQQFIYTPDLYVDQPAEFERANYMKVLASWKYGTFS